MSTNLLNKYTNNNVHHPLHVLAYTYVHDNTTKWLKGKLKYTRLGGAIIYEVSTLYVGRTIAIQSIGHK